MININREQLYELLWSKPLPTVANHCQMSIPLLRQICLSYDIPLPWRSYKDENDRKVLPPGKDFQLPTAIAEARNSLHFAGESEFRLSSELINPDPLIVAAQRTIREDFNLHGMPHMLRATYGELAIRSSQTNMDRALRIMDALVKAWKHRDYRIVNQKI